jgi:glycosyltransferase involved in cell wall biosynthesis
MQTTPRTAGLKIGILGWELLQIIGGANDFMRNILRALTLRADTEIFFICPPQQDERLYAYYLAAAPKMVRIFRDCEAHTLTAIHAEYGIDLFLLSIYVYPTSLPQLVYWPDCQHRHLPEFFDEESKKVRDNRITSLLGTGKAMIVNAREVKTDMCNFYGANAEQIFDLPVAPIVEFDHLVPRPELALKHNVKRPYFIVCNQFWVHKSLETVVDAATILRNRRIDVGIVFTGKMEEPRQPGYPKSIRDMADKHGLGDMISFLGHLSKPEQLELMKQAIAVVQPTLFEGGPGGGSVYDATGIGVRAIVSDIPVNRELPNEPDRIVYFRPRDAADLADKMAQMIGQPYEQPSIEDLYQLTQQSIAKKSKRLYEAIEYELASMQDART